MRPQKKIIIVNELKEIYNLIEKAEGIMFQKKIIIVNELKEIHDLGKKAEGIMFKKVYFERFSAAVRIVKNLLSVLRFFETANDT